MKASAGKRNFPLLTATPTLPLIAPLRPVSAPYAKFSEIDGRHAWRHAVPGAYIDYPARILRGSKIVFCNFPLAKEIGLIDENHKENLNPELERALIETFSLRILNEYDQLFGLRVNAKDLKAHTYMATRYLQLQHSSKQGATSGDGRSIWNGSVVGKNGVQWDFSSCGTGATRLSPAFSALGKPIRTGDPEVSYGSGLADIDEGLTAAILSEAFHAKGIHTERTLCVIELPDGNAVNVRAAPNLLRPSHLFLPLKQGNHEATKRALDFYIAREMENKHWPFGRIEVDKYQKFLSYIAKQYGRFAARLEDEYIFCWMDWDGDNMLTAGGIIDYGSIRQFGLCHHRYRYDDVDRYSTNLKEQKQKAKNLVQVFAQLVDFVESGTKKDLKIFESHPALKSFDRSFQKSTIEFFCARIGLSPKQREKVLTERRYLVDELFRCYRTFERMVDGKGLRKTPDGINETAILDMRKLLRELPKKYLEKDTPINSESFFHLCKSNYTSKKFLKESSKYQGLVTKFQNSYRKLAQFCAEEKRQQRIWIEWTMRSNQKNQSNAVTGDGIILVVEELLKRRKNLGPVGFQDLLDTFIDFQCHRQSRKKLRRENSKKVFEKLLEIVENNRHSL